MADYLYPFTQADGAPAGLTSLVGTAFSVVSNALEIPASISSPSIMTFDNTVADGLYDITADFTPGASYGTGQRFGFVLRAADTGNYYYVSVKTGTFGNVYLYRYKAFSQQLLASGTEQAISLGALHTLRVNLVDNAGDPRFIIDLNGVNQIDFTDTADPLTTPGPVGIYANASGDSVIVDDVAITTPASDPVVAIDQATQTVNVPFGSSTYNINLTATATDNEDGDLTASISWERVTDGGAPVSIGTGGSITTDLPIGVNVITASVTDSDTQSGSDSITVTVDPYVNQAPTVTIDQTDQNVVLADGETSQVFNLTGTAADTEDGDITANIQWTIVTDGGAPTSLGSGGSVSPDLAPGEHVITATVEDAETETATDSITINLDPPFDFFYDFNQANGNPVGFTQVSGTQFTVDNNKLLIPATLSGSHNVLISDDVMVRNNYDVVAKLRPGPAFGGSQRLGLVFRAVNSSTFYYLSVKFGTGGNAAIHWYRYKNFSGELLHSLTGLTIPVDVEYELRVNVEGVNDCSIEAFLDKVSMFTATDNGDAITEPGTAGIYAGTVSGDSATADDLGIWLGPAFPEVSINEQTQEVMAAKYESTYSFALTATASDEEDGDLTASIDWTRETDGGAPVSIGTGGSVTPDLPIGVNVITASITDSSGRTTTATITVTVLEFDFGGAVPVVGGIVLGDGVTHTQDTFSGTEIKLLLVEHPDNAQVFIAPDGSFLVFADNIETQAQLKYRLHDQDGVSDPAVVDILI